MASSSSTPAPAPATAAAVEPQGTEVKCSICFKVFKNKRRLGRHMPTHTGERKWGCDLCDAAFLRRAHLKRHMLSHTQERPFQCEEPECGKRFNTKSHLRRHMKSHQNKLAYACTEAGCGERFSKAHKLREHMCIHTGELPFHCPESNCQFACSDKREMKKHKHLTHDPKRHVCPMPNCTAAFARFLDLRKHMPSHPERFKCDHCGKQFKTGRALRKHLPTHDPNRETYPCPYPGCQKTYKTEKGRRVHVRGFHLDIKPYVCEVAECGKRFADSVNLCIHRKVHANKNNPQNKPKARKPKSAWDKVLGKPKPAKRKRATPAATVVSAPHNGPVIVAGSTPATSAAVSEPSAVAGWMTPTDDAARIAHRAAVVVAPSSAQHGSKRQKRQSPPVLAKPLSVFTMALEEEEDDGSASMEVGTELAIDYDLGGDAGLAGGKTASSGPTDDVQQAECLLTDNVPQPPNSPKGVGLAVMNATTPTCPSPANSAKGGSPLAPATGATTYRALVLPTVGS